ATVPAVVKAPDASSAATGASLTAAAAITADAPHPPPAPPRAAPAPLPPPTSTSPTRAARPAIRLACTTVGSDYSQLAVAGGAALGGSLDVADLNNFVPNPGDTFAVLTFASHTGAFDSSSGLDFGNSIVLLPEIAAGDTGLNLVTFVTT